MRGRGGIGVIADQPLFDRNSGQFGDRHLDPRHLLPTQVGAHDERDKGVLALGVAQDAAQVGLGDLDQPAERRQRHFEIAGLLGNDNDAVIRPVVGERDTEAVEDPPARRGEKPQIDAVLVGHDGVTILVEDLQLVHAAGEGGAEQCLAAGEQGGSPGEEFLAVFFPFHRRAAG